MINQALKVLKNPKLVFIKIKKLYFKIIESYYASKDSKELKKENEILFVDLGANLGQGYSWFSKYFNTPNFKFELFEPNPNCLDELKKLPSVIEGKVILHQVGVGAQAGSFKFYGLASNEGGEHSQGGSIVKDHNSDMYKASEEDAIDVEVINFSNYLKEKRDKFDKIVVKMDIEGAEVDLLEKMIADNSIDLVDYIYIEFHAQYQSAELSKKTRIRELAIIENLRKRSSVNYRIWH